MYSFTRIVLNWRLRIELRRFLSYARDVDVCVCVSVIYVIVPVYGMFCILNNIILCLILFWSHIYIKRIPINRLPHIILYYCSHVNVFFVLVSNPTVTP